MCRGMAIGAFICFAILFAHGLFANGLSIPEKNDGLAMSNNEKPEVDDGRIVGGVLTTVEKHPHQISLRFKGRHVCGGSIISEHWIVTAAHCASISENPSQFTVSAGVSFLNETGQLVKVKKIIIHNKYDDERADYDIALMKLERELEFGERVGPIELPSRSSSYKSGTASTVTGWGRTKQGGASSNQLREVSVPIVSNPECSKIYGRRRITPRMICAGYLGVGGKDACQGDSGGPLVRDACLIGIVSWGYGCADIYPGVYTRVTVFLSWISENTGIQTLS